MLTTSHIQAPAGLFCDASSGRRTGISARGYVRCPILDPVQDLPGERSNALPGIMVLPAGHVPPANFPRLGFGRARASIDARCGTSCQIIRREPHIPVSVSNFQHGQRYRVEVLGCGKGRLEIEKVRSRRRV